MYGAPDLTCLLCKVRKVEKDEMADLRKSAYRLQGYEGDIGSVPSGQEGKIHK
jgi:hypothetical protein